MNKKLMALYSLLFMVGLVRCDESILLEQLRKDHPELCAKYDNAKAKLNTMPKCPKMEELDKQIEAFLITEKVLFSGCEQAKNASFWGGLTQDCLGLPHVKNRRSRLEKQKDQLLGKTAEGQELLEIKEEIKSLQQEDAA